MNTNPEPSSISTTTGMSHRPHQAGGAFGLAGVLVAAAERPNPDEPMSLLQCWLPLTKQVFDKNGPAGYRHPGVIPVLNANHFSRIAPSLDSYVAERNWVLQPVLFFYRPQALIDLLGEDGRSRTLPVLSHKQPMPERVYVDATAQNEKQPVIKEILDLCVDVLKQTAITLPSYLGGNSPRISLTAALMDFPFLVHHIFKEYPNLHALRHRARVNEREDVVLHIRYRRKDVFGLNTDKLYRKDEINVIP